MVASHLPSSHSLFTTLVCTILRICEICRGKIGDFSRFNFFNAKMSCIKSTAFKWTASGKVQAFTFSIILRRDRLIRRQSQTCTQALEKPSEIVVLSLLHAAHSFSKRIISKWTACDITRFAFRIPSSTNCTEIHFLRLYNPMTKWLSTKQ